MADTEQEVPDGASAPDLSAYAQDLITLWQSELSALAVDREMQEGFQRGLALWGAMAQNLAQSLPKGPQHEAPRRTGPAAAPRSAADSAASDARDAELARLAERVAELERRLAELTHRP
jgi:uncharacterized protein YceH (UPF0502 family)